MLVQYPGTYGDIIDLAPVAQCAHGQGALLIVAADPLSLLLLEAPGDAGADIVVGSMQRFGVPMGFGGRMPAYMATTDKLKRSLPGRLVGQSITASGESAYRLPCKRASNTFVEKWRHLIFVRLKLYWQLVATFYACYHGPVGLRAIAQHVREAADSVAATLKQLGVPVINEDWFDTLHVQVGDSNACLRAAVALGYNLRRVDQNTR